MGTMCPKRVRATILEFVDSVVPGGSEVWLTGSRIRGDAGPNSDWDVVAFTEFASKDPRDLFITQNQVSDFLIDGGPIELVIAHPIHWNDGRQYMVELRTSGVKLR